MDLSMNHSLSELTCCSVLFFLNSSMSIILNQSKNSTVSRLKKFGCTKNKPANAFWCLLWFPYSAVYEESVKGWKIKEAFKSVSVTLKKKKKKRGCLVSSDFDLISGSNKQLMQIIQQQSGAIILNMCPLFLNVEGSKPVFIFWQPHSASTVGRTRQKKLCL